MPAKKFLGLGFTFAATDKGLEKKLSNVAKLVGDINSTLGDISKNAKNAEDAMNGFTKSGRGGGGSKKKRSSGASGVMNKLAVRGARDVSPFQRKGRGLPPPSGKGDFINASYRVVEDVSEAVKKSSKTSSGMDSEILAELKRIRKTILKTKFTSSGTGGFKAAGNGPIGSDSTKKFEEKIDAFAKGFSDKFVGGEFLKDAKKKTEEWAKQGKSYTKIMEDLKTMSDSYKEAERASNRVQNFLKSVLSYTKQWGSSVMGSLSNFMSTLGIDIQTIFPKEIRAFGNVLMSVAKPLKDGAAKLGQIAMGKVIGMFGGKAADRKLEQIRKMDSISAKATKETASNLGGSSTSTIFDKLSEIAGNTTQKGKSFLGGIFDKLKGWLIPLGVAALGLFKKFGTLKSASTILSKAFDLMKGGFGRLFGGLKNLVTMASRLIPSWGSLVNLGRALVNGLGRFSGFLLEVAVPLSVIGTALAGFASGLWEYKDEILGFFSELGKAFVNVGKYLISGFEKILAPIGGYLAAKFSFILDPLAKAFNMIGDIIVKVYKMIFDGWKMIGQLIGEGFSFGKNMLKMFNSSVEGSTVANKNAAARSYKEAYSANAPSSPVTDYKELIQANEINTKNNEYIQKQNSLLEEQNILMKQILDAQIKTSEKGVKVEVKAARGFDAVTRSAESRQAALRGSL